jgi:hypothetical protein
MGLAPHEKNSTPDVSSAGVWRMDCLNGRYVYLSDVTEVDDRWLRGTNNRGRSVLVRRDLVRATAPAG